MQILSAPGFTSPSIIALPLSRSLAPDPAEPSPAGSVQLVPGFAQDLRQDMQHMTLVDSLAHTLGPALGLADAGAGARAPEDAELLPRVLKQLGMPGTSSSESIAQWIAENSRAFVPALANALRDTLPASKHRDSLQLDLEDELKQWAAQPQGDAAPGTQNRLLSIVARFAAYELQTMPASARESGRHAAASGGPDLSPHASSSYALTLPVDRAIRTDDLSIKLAQDLRRLIDLAAQHHENTTAQVRQQIRDTITSLKAVAVQLLVNNRNDNVAKLIRDEPNDFRDGGAAWAWAADRSRPGKALSALVDRESSPYPESDARNYLHAFQQKLRSHIFLLKVAQPTVFQKYGDPFIPLVENARKARDEMATNLSNAPSDSMTLATLHQRQADFSVLTQALSSVIRNLQRIADNIINAMR